MNWLTRTKRAEHAVVENFDEFDEQEMLDPVLRQALGDFKASVHAWSDAERSRPRTLRAISLHRSRVLVGWGLAAALLAATAAGGAYEHRQIRRAQQAMEQRMEQERAAERVRLQAQQEEELFASMDTAVSREVPSAMEPLAVLATDGSETNR